MAVEVGCPLTAVNFCPIPASHEHMPAYCFVGGSSVPTAPTQYSSVEEFCEFLRTSAVLKGDHAIRRTWVECLRGAAYFWFYHTLPMGTRKYLADAHISEVTDALMGEFRSRQYISSCGPGNPFLYGSGPRLHNSSYETCSQGSQRLDANRAVGASAGPAADDQHGIPHSSKTTLAVRPASNHVPKSSPHRLSSLPIRNELALPADDLDADKFELDRRSPSRSPQARGRYRGSRIPRSPVCDDGTPLLGQAFSQQFEMVNGQYPTHADVERQEAGNSNEYANGLSNGHANGHNGHSGQNGRTSGNGYARGKSPKECEACPKLDQDLLMADAPRTPRQSRPHKPNSPNKGRSAVGKPKSTPKRLTTRNIDANELVSIVERSSRRTRSSTS